MKINDLMNCSDEKTATSIYFVSYKYTVEKLFAGTTIVSRRWARKERISMILKNMKQMMSTRKLKQVPRGNDMITKVVF